MSNVVDELEFLNIGWLVVVNQSGSHVVEGGSVLMRKNGGLCRESVPERIEAAALFAGFGARTGGAARIPTVRGSLFFCRHVAVVSFGRMYARFGYNTAMPGSEVKLLKLQGKVPVNGHFADGPLLEPAMTAAGDLRCGSVRVGNWLTAEQAKRLRSGADRDSLRGNIADLLGKLGHIRTVPTPARVN